MPLSGGIHEQYNPGEVNQYVDDCSPDGAWFLFSDITNEILYAYNTQSDETLTVLPPGIDGYMSGSFFPDGSMICYLVWAGDENTGAYEVFIRQFQIEEQVASLTLTSPNGGEEWTAGTTFDITWTSSGIENVSLLWRKDDTLRWIAIQSNVPAGQGSF